MKPSQTIWVEKFVEMGCGTDIPAVAWWVNPIKQMSLRLSYLGFNTLRKNGNFKFYNFELLLPLKPKSLLQLERCFSEPYFIHHTAGIYIMSEVDVMMLALHSNNLQNYLDTLSL